MLAFHSFIPDVFSSPLVLACGVFDGAHCGHQALLARARELAASRSAAAVTLTFDPHPRAVLLPNEPLTLLTTLTQRLRLFEELGIGGCAVVNFTPEISRWSAAEFVDFLRAEFPRLRGLTVGAGWRFGSGRSGDVMELRRLVGDAPHLEVLPPVIYRGERISSSRIRRTLATGNLAEAKIMLGRDFTLAGAVIKGRQVGRTLGFPTANLAARVPLPNGSYAARVEAAGASYPAAVYLGRRPTYGGDGEILVEAHLLDVDIDLYGQEIAVRFIRQIRGERQFADETELRRRIAADVEEARKTINN
ncbi:MAG: riboflavin biosynthesis protein RibF [Planctomycetota bacterium]|jgi:riboflavin kinase/FMN adenylyltransferase|nr:riboflavin biosynthesis protein RibF [Planctomycetota bacterium]